MTDARLYTIWVCPDCGAWAGSDYLGREAPPLCKRKAGERDKRVFPSCRAVMDRVEVLSADSVAELVQAADSLAGRVEDIVDTANWQKDPVTVARKLAVPLGKYQAAREAFPTQPEPERKQNG